MRGFVLAAAMILVLAGAQADESRNLSLGGSDKAVQQTKTAEPVSAIDTVWAPMPRGEEAKTTRSIDTPKFTECPPGVEMSKRSRMKAAGSQRRVVSRMARADVRRPHHQGWSAARIVPTLHHFGTCSAPRHQKLIAHGEAQTFDDARAAAERAKTRPYRPRIKALSRQTCRYPNKDNDNDPFQLFRTQSDYDLRRAIDDSNLRARR